MNRSLKLAVPVLLAGLLAGFWIGARCERAAERRLRRDGPNVEKIHRKFVKELALDASQSEKVKAILDARKEKFTALRRGHHGQFEALRAEMDKEIEALLSDAQKPRFAALRERWRKKHAERHGAR